MSHSLTFLLEAELTPSKFAELGRPAGAYRRNDGSVVALISDFDLLYWPARALYEGHRIRHRVSLYSEGFRARIGVFDGARFPINDLAFHPSRPLIAIATGVYDGGFFFEGELLLWNWETGESLKVLSENREVSRVRFVDSDSLVLLLRPPDEEMYGEDAAFDTSIGGTLTDLRPFKALGLREGESDPRIQSFTPIDPALLQFDCGSFKPEVHNRHWQAALGSAEFEPRYRVWDIAWMTPNRLLAVHDCCHVESWTLDGRRVQRISGSGHGVELLQSSGVAYVNVIERANVFTGASEKSTLLRIDDDNLIPVASFEHGVLFSVDRMGRFLSRDTGDPARKRARRDQLLDSTGRELLTRDLGHYDCFNHYLRIDGAAHLYFLRGTPSTSHEAKVLSCIDGSGVLRECFPWDSEARHLMCSSACLLSTDTLVRGYRVYDPKPSHFAGYIEALEMPTGRRRWRRAVPALTTCLAPIQGYPWLIYALTDGRIGVLHVHTGDLLHEQTLQIDHVNTMVLSLSVQSNRVACGTLDGRVLILRVDERR
jgi:hypothetical protein